MIPEDTRAELESMYVRAKGKKHGEVQVHILGYLSILSKLDQLGAIIVANSPQEFEWPVSPPEIPSTG